MKQEFKNLNKEVIRVENLSFGKNYFKIKIGKKFYNLRLDKNALSFSLYLELVKPNSISNYTLLCGLKNCLILDRKFFEKELSRLLIYDKVRDYKIYFYND